MPKDIEYHIGDIVHNPRMGEGIILGQHVHPDKGHPVYHVYFYTDKLYRYAFSHHIEFTCVGDGKTIETARDLILALTTPGANANNYEIGDMVMTPLGEALVLDNGHERPCRTSRRIYYHMATDIGEHRHYMDTVDIIKKTKSADSDSVKRAKRILMEQVLTPAYTDD